MPWRVTSTECCRLKRLLKLKRKLLPLPCSPKSKPQPRPPLHLRCHSNSKPLQLDHIAASATDGAFSSKNRINRELDNANHRS